MEMKVIFGNENKNLFIRGVSLAHINRNIKDKIEQIASIVKSAGAKDVVLMDHFKSTTNLAKVLQSMKTELNMIGGIVLNKNVGGLNADLVEKELSLGANIIWMPTLSVENITNNKYYSSNAVPLTTNRGTVVPAVYDILDLIAQKKASLGTGYLSPEEVEKIIILAKTRGVKKFIVSCTDKCEHSLPVENYKGISFEKRLALCTEKKSIKKMRETEECESSECENTLLGKVENLKWHLKSAFKEEIVFRNIAQHNEYSLNSIVN